MKEKNDVLRPVALQRVLQALREPPLEQAAK
jgi:hypothetical protein